MNKFIHRWNRACKRPRLAEAKTFVNGNTFLLECRERYGWQYEATVPTGLQYQQAVWRDYFAQLPVLIFEEIEAYVVNAQEVRDSFPVITIYTEDVRPPPLSNQVTFVSGVNSRGLPRVEVAPPPGPAAAPDPVPATSESAEEGPVAAENWPYPGVASARAARYAEARMSYYANYQRSNTDVTPEEPVATEESE